MMSWWEMNNELDSNSSNNSKWSNNHRQNSNSHQGYSNSYIDTNNNTSINNSNVAATTSSPISDEIEQQSISIPSKSTRTTTPFSFSSSISMADMFGPSAGVGTRSSLWNADVGSSSSLKRHVDWNNLSSHDSSNTFYYHNSTDYKAPSTTKPYDGKSVLNSIANKRPRYREPNTNMTTANNKLLGYDSSDDEQDEDTANRPNTNETLMENDDDDDDENDTNTILQSFDQQQQNERQQNYYRRKNSSMEAEAADDNDDDDDDDELTGYGKMQSDPNTTRFYTNTSTIPTSNLSPKQQKQQQEQKQRYPYNNLVTGKDWIEDECSEC